LDQGGTSEVIYPGSSCVYLVLNASEGALRSVQARRAVVAAIDVDAMVRIFFGGAEARLPHIVPKSAAPALAFSGPSESGESDVGPISSNTPLIIGYPRGRPGLELAAERLRVDLMVAGIEAEPRAYLAGRRVGYDMFIIENLVPDAAPAYSIWSMLVELSELTGNLAWLRRPGGDWISWLSQLDADYTDEHRLLPLYRTTYKIAVDSRLRNLKFRHDGTLDFESAWIAPPEEED
jgi:MarR-like DNA-binding transcriptional regulator SgrR of sgrS sRNA